MPQHINDNEEEVGFYLMETKGAKISFVIATYMPPRKPSAKLVKEPKDGNFARSICCY